MKYSFKKSALENEKEYSLLEDQLVIKDLSSQNSFQLPYENIAQIKLKFLAKRSQPDAYLCEIITKNGKSFMLSNQHFKGFASFESRSAAYSAFLQELHKKLENKPVEFRKGNNSIMNMLGIVFFIFFGLIALAIALAALIPYGLFIIAMVVYLGFRLKKYYQKNKGGTYSPAHIPVELLP